MRPLGRKTGGATSHREAGIDLMFTARIAAITTASLIALTLSAGAQMMGPGMMGPGMGPGFGAPPPQQQPQQVPPCVRDFMPLRAEAEKRANSLKAVMQKKPTREEACAAFKSFSGAESRVVKYVKANGQSCGIPPEAVKGMAANHARTMQAQKQICDGGGFAGGAPKPTGPGLSEALGTNRPIGSVGSGSSGALNTLSGSVLER
jgi:hypothetical protein